MILRALYDLAVAEGLRDDPDYVLEGVAYLVRVDAEGRLLGIESTRPPQGDSKRRPRPKRFKVPREAKRGAANRALLLVDKPEYAFEIDLDGKRTAEKLADRHRLFRERVASVAEATDDPGVAAVLAFLERLAAGEETVELPEETASNDLFAFVFGDDEELVVRRPAVRAWWARERRRSERDEARCLVTGEMAPTARLHTAIKGIPGAMSSGVPLVSFNKNAFESYGWSSNDNAPVSQEAAEGYAAAIKRLLDRSPRKGPVLHRVLSADTVVTWWAPEDETGFVDVFGSLLDADPEAVGEAFQSIWSGRVPDLALDGGDAAERFYGLTFSGAQGRVVIRDWLQTTVRRAAENLAAWFEDLAIVRNTPPPKKGGHPPGFSLLGLVRSLAVRGDRERVPPSLAGDLFRLAVDGGPLPTGVLQRALIRTRAEIGDTSWASRDRRDHRMALLKAYLNRRHRDTTDFPEIHETMDETNTQPGYLLGRLMAVLERLQQQALGDVNASVVDRFFATASSSPRAVFPRLLKGARHHARKAKDDETSRGYATHLERTLDEILAHFEPTPGGFPLHMGLDQQGLFLLGYHHQRHAFFTKKKDKNKEREDVSQEAAEA